MLSNSDLPTMHFSISSFASSSSLFFRRSSFQDKDSKITDESTRKNCLTGIHKVLINIFSKMINGFHKCAKLL